MNAHTETPVQEILDVLILLDHLNVNVILVFMKFTKKMAM